MRHLALALSLACPAFAWAEPFVLDLPPGTHNLSITVAADGTVTARPLRTVTVGGGPTNPPPVDPIPSGPLGTQVQKLTRAAVAAGGTPETAARLSALYSAVGDEVKSGGVKVADAGAFLKAAADRVLETRPDKAAWTPWRAGVSAELTALNDRDQLTTAAQWHAALSEIGTATRSAIGAATAKAIDWATILEIIKIIIEVLKAFRPM
jgi:hypothetical protein